MSVNHSSDMPRVLDEKLGYYGDVRLLNDEPFSGIGYSEYFSGQLEQEIYYREGLPDGIQKQWYESGQLKEESNAVPGLGSNKVTVWYESGQMASVSLYEAGVKIEYRVWSEDGDLIKDEVITPNPALKNYMERMKKIKGN